MRSAASFKGHPVHAMLIPFPIAFFVGAFVADLIGFLRGADVVPGMAGMLAIAGVVMGLVAAVPGAVDLLRTVPPDSSGRTRGVRHALANVGAVVLFVVGLWLRGGVQELPSALSLSAWAAGLVLLTMGGWMGGTLVYRNQIGVDHRYARAGKWNESRLAAADRPLVARSGELEVDQMKLVHVDGERIVVARSEEGYVAFQDHCPHRGASLAGGTMICGTVQCPWHGSQFAVHDGSLRAGPAEEGIRTYPVVEEDGQIRIVLRG
jgi:nitrite reductase/ring-hydroxylating ferredoxin subunit/uncharacterized membrane protein